jgi:hypothetical protein
MAPTPDPPPPRRARPASAGAGTKVARKPLVQVAPEDGRDKELAAVLVEEAKRSWPGVLISLALHIVVLVLAGMIPILLANKPPIGILEMEWGDPEQAPKAPEPVRLTTPIQLNQPRIETPTTPVEPEEQDDEPESAVPLEVAPVAVSHSLGGRQEESSTDVARSRDGFNEDSRKAIDRGLIWLKKQQFSDGHWSLDGPYADGATRTRWSTDVGATGLALLVFLGDGHTPTSGEHAEIVDKGIRWLIDAQRPTGEIYEGTEEGEEPSIYSHAICTIVLCEALALTADERLREPAQKGIDYLVAAQNPILGGWRYRPLKESGEGDLSVTGWALMALHTGRMAGLKVPNDAYVIASSFLDRCQETPGDQAHYKYTPTYPADREQRLSMTASGLLARQWLGWPHKHTPLRIGIEYLLGEDAAPDWDNGRRNVYGWYYQAEALHNMGGERWKEWFAVAQREIVENQQESGKEAGSWHPTRPVGSVHEWSSVVGRLYVTVMCLLVLETPFRHAPLYESDSLAPLEGAGGF